MQKDPDKKPEQSFVSRWSRRKTEVAEREEAQIPGSVGEMESSGELVAHLDPDPEMQGDEPQETGPENVLTDEDMPPIDSLTEDSDFSMFMSPGVSDTLRKLALRKLFSGASFNIRDGLDDYDDDFRSFAALGDIITCDMKHQMELEEERKRKQEEEDAANAEETEATQDSEPEEIDGIESEEPDPADIDTQTAEESSEQDEVDVVLDSNRKTSETS